MINCFINKSGSLFFIIAHIPYLGIFIDFSKAFDTVDHSILCSKLKHYGIQGNMHKLIESYLSNRNQYVNRFWLKWPKKWFLTFHPKFFIRLEAPLSGKVFYFYINLCTFWWHSSIKHIKRYLWYFV